MSQYVVLTPMFDGKRVTPAGKIITLDDPDLEAELLDSGVIRPTDEVLAERAAAAAAQAEANAKAADGDAGQRANGADAGGGKAKKAGAQ